MIGDLTNPCSMLMQSFGSFHLLKAHLSQYQSGNLKESPNYRLAMVQRGGGRVHLDWYVSVHWGNWKFLPIAIENSAEQSLLCKTAMLNLVSTVVKQMPSFKLGPDYKKNIENASRNGNRRSGFGTTYNFEKSVSVTTSHCYCCSDSGIKYSKGA